MVHRTFPEQASGKLVCQKRRERQREAERGRERQREAERGRERKREGNDDKTND